MGYADTFYKKENILGYTGDVDKDPTVYFASIDGTTQLVKGRQQLLTQFGHITTAHPTANNVGREPVRECYSYSICNVEYEGKQCAQECVYGQQELDKTGLGSQYKTPRWARRMAHQPERIHPGHGRNPRTTVSRDQEVSRSQGAFRVTWVSLTRPWMVKRLSRQHGSQHLVRDAVDPPTEAFSRRAIIGERREQARQRIGGAVSRHAMADASRDGAVLAERAADEHVVAFDLRAVARHQHSLKADVGDPVLAARVRASGDVQLHVGVETRERVLEVRARGGC